MGVLARSRSARRSVWAFWAVVAAAVATACALPEYQFVGDEGAAGAGTSPPLATPTACSSDEECGALPATALCNTEDGYCVECVAEREVELNRCGDGLYCDGESDTCAVGCSGDGDCGSLTCDLTRGLCTGCTGNEQCGLGTVCEGAVCAPSCAGDTLCPSGFACCDGRCENPLTAATHCGACGVVCADGGACWNGRCGTPVCPSGSGECDGDATNGCETDLTNDAENCGRCGRACASGLCAGAVCTTVECAEGFADCNQDESDRCEANLSNVETCGSCGEVCSGANGTPSCTARGCAIACDAGHEDCDGDTDTGCEVDTSRSLEHCGACGNHCENEHGTTRCNEGTCAPECSRGFGDCDAEPANGCETDLTSSLSDCGACGARCTPDNASGSCSDGVCEIECREGFADCNGDPDDGCEADLLAPETCGSCDVQCPSNGGTASCNADGTCGLACHPGRADCENGLADGCETDTNVSVLHCGACGTVCTALPNIPACNGGVCGISGCGESTRDCDASDDVECETEISDDEENCGGCGQVCFYPNGSGSCTNGSCALSACDEGFADCSAELGCETALGTVDDCRACGERCENDHGSTRCGANGCLPSCAIGWGDCDGIPDNGCETPLDTLFNCGACGVGCSKAHGVATCATGTCEVDGCDTNWEDCDDEAVTKNGCETPLNTLMNCGGCGVPCDLAHGSETCGSGSCTLSACETGWADCSSQAGCETELGTLANCTGCGDRCVNENGSTSCTSSGCTPVCSSGYKSCDGDRGNGCETNVRTLANCGECGQACELPHASASCSTGTCAVTSCSTGYADCNANAGCETALGSVLNCLSCGNACTNAHGNTACSATNGCQPTCSAGWESCDGSPQNGCETSIWSLDDCGACEAVCDIEGSSESCGGGNCTAVSCATGFADCTAAAGCETELGTLSNCRACGESCTNAHGTTSCNATTGCAPVCATGWGDCDGLKENGCERSLTTLTDCGTCGSACVRANATASCSSGSCTLVACNAGFADCTTANGCETALGTATNCAACGNACTNTHGNNACAGTPGNYDCNPTCAAGFGDCDGNPDNGCETSLTSLDNCGACGAVCNLPGASESCVSGSCLVTSCASGFADCTAAAGCETALGTNTNCASCENTCTNTNGQNSCAGGAGSYDCAPTCSTGFASCDGNPDNGCERSVTTLTDCGSCGNPCSQSNATASCAGGSCTIASCNAGYADCNTGGGCETQLGTTSSCSACGNACTNPHGATSCTGAPGSFDCSPTCDSGWGSCDANPDNGCETSLTTTTNCGICGRACSGSTPYCNNGSCSSTPPSICSSGSWAFCDDFQDGNADGWSTTGGSWSVITDGSLVYRGGNGSFRAFAGSSSWTNQTLQSRIKVLSFGGSGSSYRAGILARYGGSTDYYAFQIDQAGDLRLLRGTSTVSGSGTCSTAANSLTTGTWYTLRLQVGGANNNARLISWLSTNGTSFTQIHDCTITSDTLNSGNAGVLTVGDGTNAEFDDFAVTTF
jgi:hypothetical protein